MKQAIILWIWLMNMLKQLAEILNSLIIRPVRGGNFVDFYETAEESSIKKLTITNIPEHSLCFTLDFNKLKQLSQYLNSKNTVVNKSCDIVIMSIVGNELIVLLADLKSDEVKFGRLKTQLYNSEVFIMYLLLLLKKHYGVELQYNIRFERIAIKGKKIGIDKAMIRRAVNTRRLFDLKENKDIYQINVLPDSYQKGIIKYSKLVSGGV